jgi:hypothetical protein
MCSHSNGDVGFATEKKGTVRLDVRRRREYDRTRKRKEKCFGCESTCSRELRRATQERDLKELSVWTVITECNCDSDIKSRIHNY